MTDTKFYVPETTLSTGNGNKLLEQLKTDLKELLNGITIGQKWLNRLELTTEIIFIDPKCNEVNRLYFLPVKIKMIERLFPK